MKAIVWEKLAKSTSLTLCEVDRPVPGRGEVLIRIQATAVNAADYRSMKMGIIPKQRIFGADIAGRIEACGPNADRFRVGDAVAGDISDSGFGGFAEYVAVSENALAPLPSGVSFLTAAALPMAGVTALQGLRDCGGIHSGQKVLIQGAGGGVGTFAVQIAKHFKAEVTAVGSKVSVEQARSLGADFVIDYGKEDFTRSAKRYDLILAVNGNRSLRAYRRALTEKGVCVLVGGAMSQVLKFILFGWLFSFGKKKMRFLAAKSDPKDLTFLMELVSAGSIHPVIDRTYPLAATAEAMQYAGRGHAHGKIVITMDAQLEA